MEELKLKIKLLHGCFTFFLIRKNSTKSRKASILILFAKEPWRYRKDLQGFLQRCFGRISAVYLLILMSKKLSNKYYNKQITTINK